MNELSYHCTIYLKSENESAREARNRLERILDTLGLEYNTYDVTLRNEDGNIIDED